MEMICWDGVTFPSFLNQTTMDKQARKEATHQCYESLLRAYKDSLELYQVTKSGAAKERIRRLIINLFDRVEGIDAIKELELIDEELGIKSTVRSAAITQQRSSGGGSVITFKDKDFEKKRPKKDVKYVDATDAVQDLMKSKMKKSEDLIDSDDTTGPGVDEDVEANSIMATIKAMTGEQLIEKYQTMAAFKVFISTVNSEANIPRKKAGEETEVYMERLRDLL